MEKNVLAAVDDSIHSRWALDYAARMAAVIPQLHLTLIYIQPTISQFLLEEARSSISAQAELKKLIAKNREAAQALLDRHQENLLRAGMPERAVQRVTIPRHLGLAKDIIDYAQNSLFDAMLIGRRGLFAVQRMFMGSVSSSLVENSRVIPVWMVSGEVRSTRIMAAVDGSESSLRAVDHLIFMLSGNPESRVSFFHVTPKLRDYCAIDFGQEEGNELEGIIAGGDKRCMDQFFAVALRKLREAGFTNERIEIQSASSLIAIGETIRQAARNGGFGTTVIGRRGLNSNFFGGRVSGFLSQKPFDAALWLVP
jgi:nucleotide-binding universal stress UspA family protein